MEELSQLKIAEAGEVWAKAQRTRRKPLASNTIASYRDAWSSFSQWAKSQGKIYLRDIQARDLALWIDSLGSVADGTAQTYSHGVLSVCRFLADREALPCDLTLLRMHLRDALPRVPASRAPEVADLRRLVTYYDNELPAGEPGTKIERDRLNGLRNSAILHTLFSTGARISEILALNIRDVRDGQGRVSGRIYVVGKGERKRAVFLRPHAQQALSKYLLALRGSFPQSEPLFISHGPRGAGGRLGRIAAWTIVTNAAYSLADQFERDGQRFEAQLLRAATPHTFRHFVATWLLNEGAQLSEVSALLGHTNTRITEQYYARHTDERLQELHDQFSPDPTL